MRFVAFSAAALLLTACSSGGGNDLELPEPPKVADLLLVDVDWTPSTPTATQTATITISIKNQGGLSTKSTEILVEVLRNPCGSKTVVKTVRLAVPALASQAAMTVQTTYNFANTAGTYGVRLTVDPDELLNENIEGWDGETNNRFDCNTVKDINGNTTLSATEGQVIVLVPG